MLKINLIRKFIPLTVLNVAAITPATAMTPNVEQTITELSNTAKDPYEASLALMASAEIGANTQYLNSHQKIIDMLTILDKTPEKYDQWMRNNSFKAWMYGRILSSANSIHNIVHAQQSQQKLSLLLNLPLTSQDNFSFHAWARGYLAGSNEKEYRISKEKMMEDARQLSINYKQKKGTLADALWAWIMNLEAAAKEGDRKTYDDIKLEMQALTKTNTVTNALTQGLLRTTQSNDYPAWGLAKVRLAAAKMHDPILYGEIESALDNSTESAQKLTGQGEYILAFIENQLARKLAKTSSKL